MDEIEKLALRIAEIIREKPESEASYAPLIWSGIDQILFAVRNEQNKSQI